MLSNKSPNINNIKIRMLGVFQICTHSDFDYSDIFDSVRKNPMANSSWISEGECPTCQKVFFMAEKYRISYGSWMSKLKRLCSFKTTISVVVLNQMESCKRIKENTFDETASNILLAFIIVF